MAMPSRCIGRWYTWQRDGASCRFALLPRRPICSRVTRWTWISSSWRTTTRSFLPACSTKVIASTGVSRSRSRRWSHAVRMDKRERDGVAKRERSAAADGFHASAPCVRTWLSAKMSAPDSTSSAATSQRPKAAASMSGVVPSCDTFARCSGHLRTHRHPPDAREHAQTGPARARPGPHSHTGQRGDGARRTYESACVNVCTQFHELCNRGGVAA